MRDNHVEDALRSVLRREGDDLTLNITARELERRLALRRRERAGRRLSLVAAGIAVVAIGGIVVAGNGWLGTGPAVGGKPAPATAAASTTPESATPGSSASPSPIASSTSDGGLGCEVVDPSAEPLAPAVVAGVVPGDSLGFGGTVVASRWNGVDSGSAGSWDGLPGDSDAIAVRPWDQILEFTSDGCMSNVSAEVLLTSYAQAPAASPTPVALKVIQGIGSRVVDVSPPATGGWTLRIRATFVTADGSEAWSETLYRVFGVFDAPKLTMTQGEGGLSVWAAASCPNYQLASGASAEDLCGGIYAPIGDARPLQVRLSADLSLAGNWRIDQAKVTAVQADLVAAGKNAPEYSVAFIDKGGTTVNVPIALNRGTWIVRVSLNASRDGDSFSAWYDLPIIVPR